MPIAAKIAAMTIVALVKEAAATALRSYRMAALGVALSDRFSDWWERLIGLGAKGIANGLAPTPRGRRIFGGRIFAGSVIAIVYTHNKPVA